MNSSIFLVFSILVFAGFLIPSHAQSSENVVINEIDINPPGDDSASVSEWVELYNPTDSDVDIGGWQIASTTVLKKTMTIPPGTIIEPGQFLTYSYQSVWFTDANEYVELRDENQVVIDKTPALSDIQNDFTSWQRLYDGYDFDASGDWMFVTSTAGSSNGKLIETSTSEEVSVSVSSEKSSYLFGEVAIITGSVSEEVFTVQPYFQPEPIIISISGPNFNKIINLYPDLNLNFETTLSLHQVLGINEGNYDVIVSYDDKTDTASFSVGFETFEQEILQDEDFSVITDKSQYIPGQIVSIIGLATEIIPFEGMKFTVTDSSGELIANGNLYPTNGEFLTSLFITTVDPAYGTYEILAEYSDKSSSTTFEVVEDVKEDVPISLWTDKDAYGLGDKVQITGRINDVWVSTLDLEIVQTKQHSTTSSDAGFKILDGLQIDGDGFFTYSFNILDHPNRLGDYKISVSKDIGSAEIVIHALENPDDFVANTSPLSLHSDKSTYEIGDDMIISGFILDPFSNSSYQTGSSVKITISNADGDSLEIIGLPEGGQKLATGGISVSYDFTAIPETSGNFATSIQIIPSIFTEGDYVVKAEYENNVATVPITILNSLDLDSPLISLDREVYGLDEVVLLTGAVPPTATQGVGISLTKPDGTVTNSGTILDNQRFSWSWITPISEKQLNLKVDEDERDVSKSNFGIYKIKVSIDNFNDEFFFKVSENPETDSLFSDPLFVSTEKSLYKAGEKLKVVGNVIQRQQGSEGLVVPERVTIQVLDDIFPYDKIHESTVYPNQGGEFSSLFELPATIFDEGTYSVKATYSGLSTKIEFSVANDFIFGLDEDVSLLLSTDKSEYYPGDVVGISGKPNKLIYLEGFDVSVAQQTDDEIDCGSFICGTHNSPPTFIRPSPSGAFTHQFVIPDMPSAVGIYDVTVDADFESKTIEFTVIDKPQTPKLDTIIEKVNRIPEKTIPVFTEEKTTDGVTIAPRVLSGSLITPVKGDESNVDLKVSTVTGTCIIGPDADCLVRESTRKPGQIYDVVEVDGNDLNVRYSGPDVRLEKFSILPVSSVDFLPDANWNVEVIKDDQVSRFYYKVTYKTLE